MGCQHSKEPGLEIPSVDEMTELQVEGLNLSDEFVTPDKKRPSSVRFTLPEHDESDSARKERCRKALAVSHPSPKHDESFLRGRTFLQSPMGKKLHFNVNILTPKRPKRSGRPESGDFCAPAAGEGQKGIFFEN